MRMAAGAMAIIIRMRRRHVGGVRHAHVAACMARFGMLHLRALGMGDSGLGRCRTRSFTALHHAAARGHVDVVKALLAVEGIEVNAKNNSRYGLFIFNYQNGCDILLLVPLSNLRHATCNMRHATCDV